MLRYDPLGRKISQFRITPFEAFIFGVIIIGLIEQILIPYLGGYFLISNSDLPYISNRVAAFVNGFIITPAVWSYFVWTTEAPYRLYTRLDANQVFEKKAREKLSIWFDQYKSSLGSKRLAWIVYTATTFFIFLVNYGWLLVEPWFGRGNWLAYSYAFILFSVAYLMVSWIVAREILTVYWVRKLFNMLGDDIVVQASHPDRAGGFGIIGFHAIRLSTLVVAIGSFLVVVTFVSALYQSTTMSWSIIQIVAWTAYIFFVPLSFGMLILPAHNAMKKYKNKRLLTLSKKIQNEISRLQPIAEPDDELIQQVSRRIELLDGIRLYMENSIPVWPFGYEILRRFTLTSLLPIVSLLGSFLIDFLK